MEKEIGKISKNEKTDIVVRIDDFGGNVGVTIREFVTGADGGYSGFTKSGTRIPASEFGKFKELINSINEEDLQAGEAEGEKEEEVSKEKAEEETTEQETL